MLSGFCCFCFMFLYKIRKTFGYVFLGYCCRFLRTLLLLFSGRCYCFPWMQLLFSPDVVTCFPEIAVVFSGFCRFCFMLLYKNFWNLYKTQYFLYKNRRKFQHVFSVFSGYILSGPRTFLLFPLSIANRKSCF